MGEPLEPHIAAQVAALKDFRELEFWVEDVRKGSELADFADRFTLVVPCCLERLRWNVVYDARRYDLPPDVIFSANDDKFQPLLPAAPAAEEAVPGGRAAATAAGAAGAAGGGGGGGQVAWGLLRSWSVADPTRLLRLVLDL
eukprot:jgi/Mesen1/5406/ME000268S04602